MTVTVLLHNGHKFTFNGERIELREQKDSAIAHIVSKDPSQPVWYETLLSFNVSQLKFIKWEDNQVCSKATSVIEEVNANPEP